MPYERPVRPIDEMMELNRKRIRERGYFVHYTLALTFSLGMALFLGNTRPAFYMQDKVDNIFRKYGM